TPVSILMTVDLPAPFSPSRQNTSPAFSASDSSRTAVTPKKRLVTPRSSMIVSPAAMSVAPHGKQAEAMVGEHGEQQQEADEKLRKVGVPAEEEDAHRHNAVGERAEDGADRRPVATGEQDAADDRSGNAREDVLGAERDVAVLEGQRLDRPGERRAKR